MKILLIFLLSINMIFALEIKSFEQLLEVYRKNSKKVEINEFELDKLDLKEDKLNYDNWQDISFSLNPVFVRGKDDLKKNDLQIEIHYKKFYFKTFYNDSLDISLNESETRIFGYENSLSNLFKNSYSIEKEIINLEKNKVKIENKIREKNDLVEVIDYLVHLKKTKIIIEIANKRKEDLLEIIEINENLLKIGEGSKYEYEFILEEKRYLEKEITLSMIEKEKILDNLKNLFKDTNINFDYFDYDSILLRDLVNISYESKINKIEEEIINKNIKLHKKNITDNILLNLEYDFESDTSLGQIKFIYKPFEKDFDKKNMDITLDQTIKSRKLKEVEEENSYEIIKVQYDKLLNKSNKSKAEYELIKRRYEYMRNLYLKGSLDYYNYLEEKDKYEEREKTFQLDKLELISFVMKNSIN